MRAQLGELDAAAIQFGQQRRHRQVKLGHLQLQAAVVGPRPAHAFQRFEDRRVERGAAGGELHHVVDADRGDQLARRPERDDLSVVHDGHAVGQPLGLVHVMRGEDDGAAGGLELLDELPHLAAGLRIEAGGGLVEEQQVGVADQRAGHREALLLAARKLAHLRARFSSSCTMAITSATAGPRS